MLCDEPLLRGKVKHGVIADASPYARRILAQRVGGHPCARSRSLQQQALTAMCPTRLARLTRRTRLACLARRTCCACRSFLVHLTIGNGCN